MYYPYSTPIILTDKIFTAHGGKEAGSTPEQRTVAYWVAEKAACVNDLETFLTPTIVTGSYLYSGSHLILDHTHINRVILTRFIDNKESIYFTVSGTANVYVSLRSGDYGLLDIDQTYANCNCGGIYPYKVQVVYESGLSSGTSYQPNILLALTTYADIILNEIIGYGNEAPGDIGLQSFRNQGYAEERVALLKTAYGSSPRANFAHRLLDDHRKYRYVGL